MRRTAILIAGLVVIAGLPIGTGAAAADPATTIHVAQKTCGSTADGTPAKPFCTIGEAAAVVRPGQTVAVGEGDYAESVVVPSGEPGKPVTFTGFREQDVVTRVLSTAEGPGFVLSGVHDVVIDGLNIGWNAPTRTSVVIENSSDVTITNGLIAASRAPGIEIKGDSRRVTVSGMVSWGFNSEIFAVRAGATDTLLTGNSVHMRRSATGPYAPAVTVTDAPRTTITNNTVVTDCLDGIAVTGASAGFALRNTIVATTLTQRAQCGGSTSPDPASTVPLRVEGAAAGDGTFDYNLVAPGHGGALYSWAGTTYADLDAFRAATGQGAHDIAADPRFTNATDGLAIGWSLAADSPAIDSAQAAAPGLLAQDLRGNAHADKPDTANSGGGYVDRGAVELVPPPVVTSTLERRGGGALERLATVTPSYAWTMDGPSGTFSFRNGDRQPVVNRTGTARFTFERAGSNCVTVKVSVDGFRSPTLAYYDSACVTVGAAYNAVTPQRVLDTRSGLGRAGTAPVPAESEFVFDLPSVAAGASAVVLNVTATQPTASGFLKVWPDSDVEPNASNVNFAAQQTIANLVTVKVRNGKVRIRNGGNGTTHVLADLAGYYANSGNGLGSAAPVRVLDTRAAVGVPGTTPIGPDGRVTVDLSGRVPAGTTAAVLNLTVTDATNGGLFTAYPPGSPVPTASNLNFVGGQTVNNMVIAPVVDGKVAFAHTGRGTVHLLADLAGWFAPGATDTYLPTWPTRLVDTRGSGVPLAPGQTMRVLVRADECGANCPPRTAAVVNLTVTDAQKSGYLSVYPYGQPRPTVSMLNFAAGQTVATLVTVGLGQDSFVVYNGGKGTVHVFVDQSGFYLGRGN
ncbi:right-handed parallel beta-helix repeat-containing protein [Asanoa siamensis]|uniref:Right handed beta helix domain-containing protein n=1 Tax=Asanoa siamensis TaxID=926357 RepID=A0ABQ4CSM5_9ACTN|nr:right-handed parallel beta-helix repeat-containing protein [Asanoa siamensis]GIF74289.1 hypothetical protein Asi02nite_38070 [Asanoa siamensis]